MPTFSPTPFDPTKPETAPSVPTTADQRGQHANGNTAFTAAHADVTALEGHVATGDIHVDHTAVDITAGAGLTGGGTIALSRTLAVGAGEGITVNADDVAAAWGGAGGDFGVATTVARSDHLHGQYLTAVVDDTAPILGGDLQTKGNTVALTRSDDSFHGLLGAMNATEGVALLYSADGVSFDPNNGGVTVEPGSVNLYGTAITVPGLKHGESGGRQVYVSESGILYGVDPPEPGWIVTDTSDVDQTLGSGDDVGAWTQVGLTQNFGGNVESGGRIDFSVFAYVVLGKDGDPTDLFDKSSSVQVGFGINGATPTAEAGTVSLAPYFSGFISVAAFTTAAAAYTAADTWEVWFRRGTGEDSSCNPWVYGTGSPGDSHEASVSVPGEGGTGATAFTGLTDTPADYVGQGSKLVSVRSDATGLEFTDPPTGSGDVTSTNPTVDGEVQIGDTTAKGIKGAGFQSSNVARLDIGQTYTSNDTRDNGGAWRFRNEAQAERGLIRARNTPTDELMIIGSTSGGPIDSTVRIQGTGIALELASAAQAVNVETGELQERSNRVLTVAGGRTVAADSGFAGTARTGLSTTITPNPTDGQYLRITEATTVNVPTETGTVLIDIDAAISITWAGGYRQIGTEASGARQAVVSFVAGGVAVVAHL